jgi:hypothetical protein
MARRRNAIFHRLSRMRGLPPDEKMLMQRIGHMMDAALNNRQASNPYEPSKNNPHRVLYPPTGLVAYTGYRTLKLVWVAADSDQHLRYEVKITNNDTGESEVKSTYTNELRYKNVNGTYTAVVKSVGRDGSSSIGQTIEFTMGSSVMQLEGSKNSPIALGTMVQDHITVYNNYSIYAWGSVVLDKYAADVGNEQSVFRLWSMDGEDQVFDEDEAILHQTITMYPASETFSNLGDLAHGAGIQRPAATRPGSFESSQSVMFAPISIVIEDGVVFLEGDELKNTTEDTLTRTFFLQALNRELSTDEVNLSLVLWGGFDGLGDSRPGDPWTPQGHVHPHLNSLTLKRREMNPTPSYDTVTKGSWYLAQQDKQYNIIDNAWTLAFWVRLESEHVDLMIDQSTDLSNAKLAAENVIFRRSSYTGADGNWDKNAIQVSLTGVRDQSYPQEEERRHQLLVQVFDADGTEMWARFETFTDGDHASTGFGWSPTDADHNSSMWGQSQYDYTVNFDWQFIVICFEGGPGGFGYEGTSLTPKIRVYTNDRQSTEEAQIDYGNMSVEAMECLNQKNIDGAKDQYLFPGFEDMLAPINQDITNDYIYSIGIGAPTALFDGSGVYKGDTTKVNNGTFTIHQAGMWNVALDNWDGKNFNIGAAEQRDSSPWYTLPYDGSATAHGRNGRHNPYSGSSLTAIHYLYNQGFGTDIDWLKNSNERIDGAVEYIFAENLIHLWQFGAIPDEFSQDARTIRDTGNHLYGGGVDFLSGLTMGTADGESNNSWSEDCELADVISQTRIGADDPWTDEVIQARLDAKGLTTSLGSENTVAAVKLRLPPVEWRVEGLPSHGNQIGVVQPAGHINAAGFPDGGTTASWWAYPGQHYLLNRTGLEYGGFTGEWYNVGWLRPNVTDGVLDEIPYSKPYKSTAGPSEHSDWKSYGPIYTSQGRPAIGPPTSQGSRDGRYQAEIDAGIPSWP